MFRLVGFGGAKVLIMHGIGVGLLYASFDPIGFAWGDGERGLLLSETTAVTCPWIVVGGYFCFSLQDVNAV